MALTYSGGLLFGFDPEEEKKKSELSIDQPGEPTGAFQLLSPGPGLPASPADPSNTAAQAARDEEIRRRTAKAKRAGREGNIVAGNAGAAPVARKVLYGA